MDLNTIKTLLTIKGRINRTEFLAYAFLLSFGYFIVILPLNFVPDSIYVVGNFIASLVFNVLFFILVINRVHDYNERAPYALLTLIPIINLFVIFASGEPVPNNYGEKRPPPSTLFKILAILFFVLPIVILVLLSFFPEFIGGRN